MKQDLISLQYFPEEEINHLLKMAELLKRTKKEKTDHLNRKTVGLLFQKPSNRTRVSFEVGIWQLGGNCIYLGPEEINLGKRESTEDVAKTLSRYLDAIVARTHSHQDVVDLAKYATIPVINGLSDLYHPCQAMADLLTIKEKFGNFKNLTLAFIGDGNNVCHSLLIGCAKVGLNINIATPKEYEPLKEIVAIANHLAKDSQTQITLTNSPQEAIEGADIVYADVWVSMGQEEETKKRLAIFKDFQINQELVSLAKKNYIFMHCLPAHRGQEVTAEVIDSKNSVVFDQAENRMHVQKAILIHLLSEVKI